MEYVLNLSLVVWGAKYKGMWQYWAWAYAVSSQIKNLRPTTSDNYMILGGNQRGSVVAAMDVEVLGSTSKSIGKVPW